MDVGTSCTARRMTRSTSMVVLLELLAEINCFRAKLDFDILN
ncbi:unnamed protein product, partial [Linum tenue]